MLGKHSINAFRTMNVLHRSGRVISPFSRFQMVRSLSDYHVNEDTLKILKNNHPNNNIPDSILQKIGRNLHLQKNHPLNIIKTKIEDYCNNYAKLKGDQPFQSIDNLSPIVTTKQCFDDLRVGPDHVSRKPSDTYYVDDKTVLRTHTSAHQTTYISKGVQAFLCTGDVYRRDEIDASHYPVFHQMEGVKIFPSETKDLQDKTSEEIMKIVEDDLKNILSGLARHLFGDVPMRWNSEYFPFTDPSFELEVEFNGKWMEVLGCGVIHREVLTNSLRAQDYGWAFGLGLERLAMILFDIPDIRLFWSTDERFLSQFQSGRVIKFIPYSKFPQCYKDVSFWLPPASNVNSKEDSIHPNDIYELMREIAGDLVEKVELIDQFQHPKTLKKSHAYRITYRSMDRNLTNKEIDEIQWKVRDELVKKLKVELR